MKFFLIVALDVEERFFPFHKTIFSFFMFDSSIDCFFFIYQDMDDAIVKKLFMGQQWKVQIKILNDVISMEQIHVIPYD